MTEEQMKEWQQLHERVGRGETLTEEEQDFYHGTIARWDAAEDVANQARLKQVREKQQRLLDMEAEYARLRTRQESLSKELSTIKEALITRRTTDKQYSSNSLPLQTSLA